jgi:hypothetical protein
MRVASLARLVVAPAVSGAFAETASAQRASVTGAMADSTGGALPGAAITATNLDVDVTHYRGDHEAARSIPICSSTPSPVTIAIPHSVVRIPRMA